MRNPARERSRNLNREVWESPSVLRRRGCQNFPLDLASGNAIPMALTTPAIGG
ncbi:hypothetical protein [Microcystis aeruginosa]|uniref:hypothetical protein n=1 Tax=Microcystis aeruginosa TaxID=1126 RepID=UPI001561AF98|nr:hypothetical protein [Microcystis aeruginosa]